MKQITIAADLKTACPNLVLGCVTAQVKVEKKNETLWQIIEQNCQSVEGRLETSDINQLPQIAASRKGYKAIGQDPSRYRLSAEALLRRVVKGKGIYQISNAVDIINFCSMKTGYSIGGYDVDFIQGAVELGIGREGEPYEAIGRGAFNIHKLPVFRDELGAFGTPTSDSVRTMLRESTQQYMMVFLAFEGAEGLTQCLDEAKELLVNYASGEKIQTAII